MPDQVIAKISSSDFKGVKGELAAKLSEHLEMEIAMSELEVTTELEPGSDLFDAPLVDSKTVVKLSPIVEEITGRQIKSEWIKSGGYDSVEEAVNHLVEVLESEIQKEAQENGQ